jgi:hypothetical protein
MWRGGARLNRDLLVIVVLKLYIIRDVCNSGAVLISLFDTNNRFARRNYVVFDLVGFQRYLCCCSRRSFRCRAHLFPLFDALIMQLIAVDIIA